jgi:hypothetical protein
VHDQIKYANCLRNVTNWHKIGNFLPKHLKYINFGRKFNNTWDKNVLPDTVEVITFHPKSKFNHNISAINLPKGLKKICFNGAFDKPIDNLPDSLEVVSFCKSSRFNRFIQKYPSSLKEIYFGDHYVRSIKKLPSGVRLIYFSGGSAFNDTIEYPTRLQKIYYGREFNQVIPAHDCRDLKVIKFADQSKFNQDIVIPEYLESIYFGATFDKRIDTGASNLRILKFYSKSKYNQLLRLPASLQVLHLGKHFNRELELNPGLKYVKFAPASKFQEKINLVDSIIEVQYPKRYPKDTQKIPKRYLIEPLGFAHDAAVI